MIKLLIVDPQEPSITHLHTLLSQAGYQILLARSGKEAQKQVIEGRPDICIIDPKLPDTDGFMLSLRIRKKFPRMGIIISTADFKGEEAKNDAKTKFGASAFLEKPYSDEKLVRIVKALWERIELRATQARLKLSELQTEKRQTLPGLPLEGLDLDRTIGLAPDAVAAHIENLKEQFVIKPQTTLFDAMADIDASQTGDSLRLDFKPTPATPPAASKPAQPQAATPLPTQTKPLPEPEPAGPAPALKEARKAASLLEKTVADPFAVVDETVASSFAKLEQSAQQAAETTPAFQPNDTLVTGTRSGDFRLTADEIFGSLISDIESGKVRRPPAAKKPESVKGPDEITQGDQEPLFVAVGADTNPNISPQGILPPSPDRTDKYELLELISEDQAFEVWKAKIKGEKGFERLMALKKIKSYLADNIDLNHLFLKEAKLAAALSHPNIAQIYELGMYEGSRFLAREFLQGETLHSLLMRCRAKNTSLPAPLAAFLGAKIADALAYAHKAQGLDGQSLHIVHHHLSPDNVIITDEGEVKVLNFGTGQVAARAAGTDMVPHEQLQSLAPEQAAGNLTLDHRADLFSLGSLLYRALTGLDPFAGTGRESVMMKIKEADSAPIQLVRPDLPLPLSAVVSKAMQADPNNRYQNAEDMAVDLRDYLKRATQRTDEADLAMFLRVIRASVAMEAPSLLPPGPIAASRPAAPSEPPAAAQSAPVADEPAPAPPSPVYEAVIDTDLHYLAPKKPAAPRSLVALVILLFLVLLYALYYRFGPSSTPTANPPADIQQAQPASQPSQPAVDPGADPASAPADTASTPEAPATAPADSADTASPAPSEPTNTETTAPTELDLELQRIEAEKARKAKELEELNTPAP